MLEENLKSKIERLISLYESERQRADSVTALLESREEDIRGYKEQITDLNQQIDSLRLATAFVPGSNDSTGARSKIDALIREIDRCIKLLET